jgi:hypothetical protein
MPGAMEGAMESDAQFSDTVAAVPCLGGFM